MTDREVRQWFLLHGWSTSAISCYYLGEEVEGWRWSHAAAIEEFEAAGSWDAPPAMSDAMVWYAEHWVRLESDAFG